MARKQHNNDTNTRFFDAMEDRVLMSADGMVNAADLNTWPTGDSAAVVETMDDVSDGSDDDAAALGDGSVRFISENINLNLPGGGSDTGMKLVEVDEQGNAVGGGGGDVDLLRGRDGNDVLIGDEGRDIIIANGGNDFVSGGEGNDILIGGDGNDVILGADGNDVLSGGRGNDILLAGDGNDVLRGGAGNDTLLGNRGNDIVLGEEGSDLLIVNNGDGSDFLEGGGFDNDLLRGRDGNDVLIGNRGNDFVFGENGNDLIVVNEGDDSASSGALPDAIFLGGSGNDL